MANNVESTKRISVEMLVLALLSEKDMYGYEMSQEIMERSGQVIFIPEGSLYITMYKLVDKGFISDRKELVGDRRSRVRVYYHIEESGKNYLQDVIDEYNRNTLGIQDFFDRSEMKLHG